jgi:hypothetical protein
MLIEIRRLILVALRPDCGSTVPGVYLGLADNDTRNEHALCITSAKSNHLKISPNNRYGHLASGRHTTCRSREGHKSFMPRSRNFGAGRIVDSSILPSLKRPLILMHSSDLPL